MFRKFLDVKIFSVVAVLFATVKVLYFYLSFRKKGAYPENVHMFCTILANLEFFWCCC